MNSEMLSLGGAGSCLRVAIEQKPTRLSGPLGDPSFSVSYEVEAHPFSGILEGGLLLDDLKKWRLADGEPPTAASVALTQH
jgi:hypothetical protein